MFSKCSSLKELDLSKFSNCKVYNMSNMFKSCSSLKKLNLSSFKDINENYCFNAFNGISIFCKLICNDKKLAEIFEQSKLEPIKKCILI